MERNQNINSNNSNSFDSNFDSSSSYASNYDYLSLYLNGGGGGGGSHRSSDSLLQNMTFNFNRLSMKRRIIGNRNRNRRPAAKRNEFVENGYRAMANNNVVEIDDEEFKLIMEGCDLVSKFAITVNGCDKLRRMMEDHEEDGGRKEMIIKKVTADLPILMVHQIGCEFAKTIFDSCNEQQMNRVLHSVLIGKDFGFLYICNSHFGKEAVKVLIKNLKKDEQLLSITNVVIDNIVSFTNTYNTQHVLQFFLLSCNNDFSRMLICNAMAKYCVEIATNRSGCMILQHCICPTYIQGDFVLFLLNNIILNSPILSEDRYGNYVVQHVILLGIANVTRCIVGRLEGRFCDLAKSKCGSNVVEKCLEEGEVDELHRIVLELTNSTQLLSIAQDPFGNYVLQCALQQAYSRGSDQVYANLVKRINMYSRILQTHLYGRTVIYKIRKLLNTNS